MRWKARLALVAPLSMLSLQCGDSPTADGGDEVSLPPRLPPEAGADTSPIVDAGTDVSVSAPACDVAKPFGAPVRLAELDALGAYGQPRLSPDELTLYFTSMTAATSFDLVVAVRASTTSPFGAPAVLPQSTMGAENDPTVGADELTLWFHSIRAGSADIFLATRASKADAFGAAAAVPTVNGGATIEATPYFRSAANELWFVSERAGSQLLDIYVAKRSSSSPLTFAEPSRVVELASAADEFLPQPSEDGLTVIFASDRAGGMGKQDLWIARRRTASAPFDAPSPLAELNSPTTDQPGWLSADGCRIWFSSGRLTADARPQIFFAQRPK